MERGGVKRRRLISEDNRTWEDLAEARENCAYCADEFWPSIRILWKTDGGKIVNDLNYAIRAIPEELRGLFNNFVRMGGFQMSIAVHGFAGGMAVEIQTTRYTHFCSDRCITRHYD